MNTRTISTLKRYFNWKDQSKLEQAYRRSARGGHFYKPLLDQLVKDLPYPDKHPVFQIHSLLNELPKGFIERIIILHKYGELDMFVEFIKRAFGHNE